MPRWPNSNDKPAIVYRAVNLINGKSYVGITIIGLIERRKSHLRNALLQGKRTALHAAIRKYGADMIRFSVIKHCINADEAKAEERRLIAAWHPEYNLTIGGDGSIGYRWTQEQREKFRTTMPRYWLGKKHPPEFGEACRKRRLGTTLSAETRKKIGLANIGKQHPLEVRLKISAAKKGKPLSLQTIAAQRKVAAAISMLKARPVTVYPDAITFRSTRDAAEHYGLNLESAHDAANRGYPIFGLRLEKSEYFK